MRPGDIVSIRALDVGRRETVQEFLARVGPQSTHSIASRYGTSVHDTRAWLRRCQDAGIVKGRQHDEPAFPGSSARLMIWETSSCNRRS